jgi:hypothetical protein
MQNHPNGADGTATIRTFRELIWRRSPSDIRSVLIVDPQRCRRVATSSSADIPIP